MCCVTWPGMWRRRSSAPDTKDVESSESARRLLHSRPARTHAEVRRRVVGSWFMNGPMWNFRQVARAACAVLSLSVVGAFGAGEAKTRSASAHPHVVELFTAQGCTGCAEADQAVKSLIGRRGLVVLTFPVDYWDYLGWKDTFARPEFTQRQAAYKSRFRLRETYSPQVVIDGRTEGPGVDGARIEGLTKAPFLNRARVVVGRHAVRIAGRSPASGADVWLVRYDPQDQPVQVTSGENRGKTLPQQNIVHHLTKLGKWRGGTRTYDLPNDSDAGLKTVILVQAPRGGEILGLGQG